MQHRRRIVALAVAGVVAGAFANHAAMAGTPEAQKWVDSEFQPSTLCKQQQMDEMKWFIDTAAKLKSQGVKEVHVVSETIDTHIYESKTLAKAFTEITGIQVKHDIIQEGDVVEKLQTSMQSGPKHLRRLDLRLGPDRHALSLWRDRSAVRLHDGRRQGIYEPGSRHQRLYRHELYDRAGQKALSASRPAVREPLLVPRRLVRAQRPAGQVQGQVRL